MQCTVSNNVVAMYGVKGARLIGGSLRKFINI